MDDDLRLGFDVVVVVVGGGGAGLLAAIEAARHGRRVGCWKGRLCVRTTPRPSTP